ncbi:unnamed protein product [Ostreobium quekettii]|uniref:Potassium channel tetramerisation-type BTB domain-containing protein n=1 Tax=Ostreobium quekettii TaxID=121088 RepID=A0A8S1IWZ4_9CHLO|nr:unnamed protein product [Ostreobium quekettii]|eukprot:evm.model.scf_490.7 EVM.evm.TU.scf_490.7   scf_490:65014-66880(+)
MASGSQGAGGRVLRLDVGGRVFELSQEMLARFPKSQFSVMCQDCPDAFTREAPLPIARSGKGFEVIVEIFRRGTFQWAQVEGSYTLSELRNDLDFYGLPAWEDLCPRPLGQKFMEARTDLIFYGLAEAMASQVRHLCTADLVKRQADFLLCWEMGQELEVHRFTCREDYETSRWFRRAHHNNDMWHFEAEYGETGGKAHPEEEIDFANETNKFRVAFLSQPAQEMMVANLAKFGFKAECRKQAVLCDSRELPTDQPEGEIQLVTIYW